MWCESSRTYSPNSLKWAISDVNRMFVGTAQHDSQELFSFLVSGLNEDLNRIAKKPYLEQAESNGREDSLVAQESWLNHIQRDQSIVVDLMTGQYKSKVTCPDCKRESITFDPFITVTLPIPEETVSYPLSIFVLFKDHEKMSKKISISFSKFSPAAWLEAAMKKLGI